MLQRYQKRTDSTQLPTAEELLDILKKESPRKAIRYDFIQRNISIFNAHRSLSNLAGADDSWIKTYPTLTLETLVRRINENHSKIAAYIRSHPGDVLYEELYGALTPKDALASSEALFVFGAASNARIERAIELYQQGVAPKIIISGSSPHYKAIPESEARRMTAFATEKGIPSVDIILEDQSITLPDNVKRSLDLLESMDWHPTSITLVATNFVLTRAVMEWYKFCPWEIQINTVAAHSQSATFMKSGWTKDNNTIALVLNEYAKLILESKIDLLRQSSQESN